MCAINSCMLGSYIGMASTHEPIVCCAELTQGYTGNCIFIPLLLLPMGRAQTCLYHTRSASQLPLVESEAPGSPSPSFATTSIASATMTSLQPCHIDEYE